MRLVLRLIGVAVGVMGLLGCCCFGPTAPPSSQQPEVQPPTVVTRPNLAANIEIKGIEAEWKAPAFNPDGPADFCVVYATVWNKGSVPVREIWAAVRIFDQHGNLVDDIDKEIIYFAEDEGSPLWPGQSKRAKGEWFLPMRDYLPIGSQKVRIEMTVTAAYEEVPQM